MVPFQINQNQIEKKTINIPNRFQIINNTNLFRHQPPWILNMTPNDKFNFFFVSVLIWDFYLHPTTNL